MAKTDETPLDEVDEKADKILHPADHKPDAPIKTEAALRSAIKAFSKAKDKPAAKARIMKAAQALGLTNLLPDSMKADESAEETTEETTEEVDEKTTTLVDTDELIAQIEAGEVALVVADEEGSVEEDVEEDESGSSEDNADVVVEGEAVEEEVVEDSVEENADKDEDSEGELADELAAEAVEGDATVTVLEDPEALLTELVAASEEGEDEKAVTVVVVTGEEEAEQTEEEILAEVSSEETTEEVLAEVSSEETTDEVSEEVSSEETTEEVVAEVSDEETDEDTPEDEVEGKILHPGDHKPDAPIKTEEALLAAIKAFPKAVDKPAARARIVKAAKALGLSDLLPDSMKGADDDLETADDPGAEERKAELVDQLSEIETTEGLINPEIKEMRDNRLTNMGLDSDEIKRLGDDAFVCALDRKVLTGEPCEFCRGGCAAEEGLPSLLAVEAAAEKAHDGVVVGSGYSPEYDVFIVDVKQEDHTIELIYTGEGDLVRWQRLEEEVNEDAPGIISMKEAEQVALDSFNGSVIGVSTGMFDGEDAYIVGIDGVDGKELDVFVSLDGRLRGWDTEEYFSDDEEDPEVKELGDELLAVEAELRTKRLHPPEDRARLAASGSALPDGSFPIANEEDLKNAIQAFGRAKDKAKAKAHIIKRARAMGLTRLLPDKWTEGKGAVLIDGEEDVEFADSLVELDALITETTEDE